MLNYIVKNKVTKDGVIIGILLNNGIETRFVPKEKFSYFSDRVFVNAKISLDGKITATKGRIPILDYKDYISERNKVLTKDKNNMVLYHGSPDIIEKPSFGYGNKRNDYGVGFYCTQNIELGREWACSKNPNGILNTYILKKKV